MFGVLCLKHVEYYDLDEVWGIISKNIRYYDLEDVWCVMSVTSGIQGGTVEEEGREGRTI